MNNSDLQELFQTMLNIARSTLPKGAIIPTAAIMNQSAEVTLNAAPYNNDEASEVMAGMLRKEAQAGQLRASGMMLDVLFNHPDGSGLVDAIVFILEHADGEAALVHQTYKKGMLRKIKFGEQFEEPMPEQMRVWTRQEAPAESTADLLPALESFARSIVAHYGETQYQSDDWARDILSIYCFGALIGLGARRHITLPEVHEVALALFGSFFGFTSEDAEERVQALHAAARDDSSPLRPVMGKGFDTFFHWQEHHDNAAAEEFAALVVIARSYEPE